MPPRIDSATAFSRPACLWHAAIGVRWSYHDIRWDYSGSTEAAAYIRDHGLTKIPIVASGATLSESILPELPGTRFWYASRHAYGTYVDWGGNWRADDKIPPT